LAVTTVAGVDFLDIANTRGATVGTYSSNWTPGGAGTEADSVVDGNGASWIFSNSSTATLDLSFGGGVFNVSDVDLSILFVGDGGHSGSVTLLGGSQSGSVSQLFNIGNGVGYTGFNSSTDNPPTVNGGAPTIYGIFSTNMHLADVFSGTFSGLRLDISNASAVPSMVGTVAVVPVPAAVWLFGSGLVGLAGVARKRG
jgi:hypothetical protein